MRLAVLLLALLVSAHGVLAQQGRAPREPPAQMSHEERQRLRQDVESARGNYQQGRETYQQRREAYPQRRGSERMPPEEREKLRRDVQDANRDLRRR